MRFRILRIEVRTKFLAPAAGEIVAEGKTEHDREPEKTGKRENPNDRFAVAKMHEEQNDERGFGNGDTQGDDGIEGAKINVSYEYSKREEDQKGQPIDEVGTRRWNIGTHE